MVNHDYYHVPSVTEASACALVMQHVNRFNGLRGSFDYITGVETVPYDEKNQHTSVVLLMTWLQKSSQKKQLHKI